MRFLRGEWVTGWQCSARSCGGHVHFYYWLGRPRHMALGWDGQRFDDPKYRQPFWRFEREVWGDWYINLGRFWLTSSEG